MCCRATLQGPASVIHIPHTDFCNIAIVSKQNIKTNKQKKKIKKSNTVSYRSKKKPCLQSNFPYTMLISPQVQEKKHYALILCVFTDESETEKKPEAKARILERREPGRYSSSRSK